MTESARFAFAIAGPDVTRLISYLEGKLGTATPQQQGAVHDEFNRACLKGAQLADGPYNYVFEKVARPGGSEGIIIKCPRIDGEFYVPADCTPIKEWQYLQALDMANPVDLKARTFSL